MSKALFNLDRHPKYGERREDLDPEQSGLLKITKKYLEKKEMGDIFEKRILEMLEMAFPEDIVIHNIIFESGNYIEALKLYESLQMDVIVVSSVGVICIEAKWISNDTCLNLTGSAVSKTWTVKTNKGTSNSEINGLKQNYRHIRFLEEIFEKEGIVCPVYQMTVIGDLKRSKILIQQFIDGNLVDTEEMIDRIKYIKVRNKSNSIDIEMIAGVLRDWECKVPGIEKLHIVYARNISTKRLPSRCKKKMRCI